MNAQSILNNLIVVLSALKMHKKRQNAVIACRSKAYSKAAQLQ